MNLLDENLTKQGHDIYIYIYMIKMTVCAVSRMKIQLLIVERKLTSLQQCGNKT